MGESFFGTTFDCTCGRTHHILPRRSFYCDDAVTRLAHACLELTAGRRVIVLMDARTRSAAGDAVVAAFADADWTPLPVIVPDPAPGRSPVCDDHTRQSLDSQLPDADLICPVGAGVINDLGKWAATDRRLPHVTFATAASMNGYTSANIAPTIGGLKRLLEGQAPQFAASSPAVLAAAPYELTASGLGDAMAKSVSSADWLCNHLLFGDYYCERSVRLIEEIEPLYLRGTGILPVSGVSSVSPASSLAQEQGKQKHQQTKQQQLRHGQDGRATHGQDARATALQALYEALLLTGAAMTMAGTSAPASGGEHLISHYLDMAATAQGTEHDLHGRQVGVGTIIASELYRRVLACESPALEPIQEKIDVSAWDTAAPSAWRQTTSPCHLIEAEYARKLPRLREARSKLAAPNAWDNLRQRLRAMVRPPEVIRDCLAAASAAHKAEHIGCSRQLLLEALTHAHEIRSRFTILDLARLAGVLPDQAYDIIEQWT
jgi:glycerol-1-phosphate dehydrogenase [NAD(P)+]